MTRQRCNASRQDGSPCQAYAMENGKCRVHGGLTPKGVNSPHFKTGKHSLYYLPTKLQKIAASIPDEFDKGILTRNTLLTEAFIRQKLESLEEAPDAAQAWDALRKELDFLISSFQNEDYGKVAQSLDKLGRLVDERILYHLSVSEIRKDLAEQRANQKAIADIEFKGQNAIPVSQLVKFLLTLTEIAARRISNKNELYAFYADMDELMASNKTTLIEAGNDSE